MEHKPRSTLVSLLVVFAFFLLATPVRAAWTESYCSPQNTANNDVYTWDFQSNGNCTNHCDQQGTFAFAVIQWRDCWCSNYIPRQQVPISRCKKDCPGFPSENCGDADNNLFIYIKNSGQPSGTAGGSQPTSATNTRPSSTETSLEPQKSIQVITESGAVVTRTVIQTPSSNPNTSSAPISIGKGDDGPNIGAIVGGVVGGVLGLLAILGGLVFFLWRRRKQRREAQADGSTSNGGTSGGITRNTSTMSKAGLLGGAMETEHPYPSRIATNFSTQNSRYGTDHDSISPISNRRNSQPLMIDSRLNPNAVITFAGANASRDSVASLDDSRDYGRQLNVRNPDP